MHEGRLGLGKPHLPGHVQATEPLWPAHVEHPVLQGCSPADHRPHSGDDVLQTMFQLTAEQMVINSLGGSAGGSLLTAIGLLLPRIKHAEQDELIRPLQVHMQNGQCQQTTCCPCPHHQAAAAYAGTQARRA